MLPPNGPQRIIDPATGIEAEPTNYQLQIALARIQNEKEWRDFWRWVIGTLIAAVPGLAAAWYSISTNSKVEKADVDRSRIEEKIDTQKEVATTAVEHAKTAAEEAKTAIQEVKTVAEEIKMNAAARRDDEGPL